MAHARATRSVPLFLASLALLTAACSGKTATAEATRAPAAAGSKVANALKVANASTSGSRTVTVDATGKARAVPDQLTARLAIHTAGPTADGVLSDANLRANAVLDRLTQDGVDAKDVQTTQVGLGPTFDKKGNVTGFAADNELEITFRRLGKAGRQLDGVVRTPGNAARLVSVSLGFNDDDKILTAARTDAVRRAREQAKEMVGALSSGLGRVRTITETRSAYPATLTQSRSASFSPADASVPIAPGTQELTVTVRVVFEIT